eukprot:12349911-Alexandrium_andersonii.AAC.1
MRPYPFTQGTLVNSIETDNLRKTRLLMDWGNGVLYVKSAQGHSRQMHNLVDMTQAIPVTGPWGDDWPRIVYHGTSEEAVPSIVQNSLGRRLAWGGLGTDRAHYHF